MTFARIRALVFVAVLFVSAGLSVIFAMVRDTQTAPVVAARCPAGAVAANIRPPERRDVKINVYNGTPTVGLATKIGQEFKNRDFIVDKMENAPGNKIYDEVAVIRYGPKAVGAGWLLRAYFLDEAVTDFDIKRKDDAVDVIIGTQFQQLATTTEVNQSIAAIGEPILPPGTCEE
jgi:LytR cell envelope-related transcriptional attenuator